MGRLKTFRTYILLLVGFYIFSVVFTYIGLNATYKNINLIETLPNQVNINLAQATTVNGRIYGEITSTQENNLNGKYIKINIYTKTGNFAGTKYLRIEGTNLNEPKKFAVYFTAENIGNYTVEILDDSEEVQKEVNTAIDLYKDIFTDEELRTYAIVTLVLALILI